MLSAREARLAAETQVRREIAAVARHSGLSEPQALRGLLLAEADDLAGLGVRGGYLHATKRWRLLALLRLAAEALNGSEQGSPEGLRRFCPGYDDD